MESQPQNTEFRNNPENFHPCTYHYGEQPQLRRACAHAESFQSFLPLVCLFDLILNIPVNNLPVLLGRVFLGLTGTKQG